MKAKLLMFTIALIPACGYKLTNGPISCVVSKTNGQSVIECPDGSTSTVSDGTGVVGDTGQTGANGHSIAFKQVSADTSLCSSGGNVINMGLDVNDDKVLQDSETTSSTIICNGVQGTQGVQGVAGVNATPVTAVQFCPGYTTTYPNSFPEYGLCINNEIYAVYFDNKNAWMAKIVPGYYSSTSTTSSCNFTVSSSCKVTQ